MAGSSRGRQGLEILMTVLFGAVAKLFCCQVRQKWDYHTVPSALSVPTMHFHS